MKNLGYIVLCSVLTLIPSISMGVDEAESKALRQEIEQLRKDYEQRVRALEERLKAAEEATKKVETVEKKSALDEALAEIEVPAETPAVPSSRDLWSRQVGGANLRFIDIGLDILVASGSSSERDAEIRRLQGGAHDPRRRGFTLQQAELSLKGAVDPYFVAEAFIIASEDEVELEEAFFTTTSLPYNLQLEGGYFLTEFGIINPTHPHAWDWIDQPIINTRLFGGEGQRAAGFRLAKLLPTSWFSEIHFGMQDPTTDTMPSFLGEGHEHGDEEEEGHDDEAFEETLGGFARVKNDVRNLGDLVYLGRYVNAWDVTPELTTKLGLNVLYGPNSTGDDAETLIYGADLKMTWRPATSFRGYPFLTWQTEIMKRDFDIDKNNPAFEPGVTSDQLEDYGLYSYLLYGFKHGWAAGLRGEVVSGSGTGEGNRADNFSRDDRFRISPMLVWQTSEFSRFRLQYNYDNADHLPDDDAHTVWLGAEVSFGAHPAHKY